MTHSEGLLEATFGGYALLVCVHVAGHLKLAAVRVVGLVLDRRRRVLGLAVVGGVGPALWARNKVLLAWWLWGRSLRFVFPLLVYKGLHKLGTNG